jgi:putative membrane protein
MIDYDPKNWLSVLLRIRGSVAPRVLPRTIFVAVMGAIAAWAYEHHSFKIPPFAHTIIGVALGLLLVFRTNASFDRWWEGRKHYGMLVNRTRDLARQLRGYAATNPESRAVVERIVRWVDLFFALVVQTLRSEADLTALGNLATTEEREILGSKKMRPALVLAWITAAIDGLARGGVLTDARLLAIDGNLTSFLDSSGACERIARTPVPFAYAQHIKVFVTLFCLTLPFVLVDGLGWMTPAAAACLAYALFGIDEIGVEIEDPFGYDPNDLPSERVAKTIQSSLSEVSGIGVPRSE